MCSCSVLNSVGVSTRGSRLRLLPSLTGTRLIGLALDTLNSGGTYICRVPDSEIQLAAERGFRATDDYEAVRQMDAIIICVPTPLDEYRQPDLHFITGTVERLATHLRAG